MAKIAAKLLLDNDNNFVLAFEWAQRQMIVQEHNELCLTQLGLALNYFSLYADAIKAFQKAKSLPNWSWRCAQGLAKAYAFNDKHQAVEEMEGALKTLRERNELSDPEQLALIENLELLADWQVELNQPEQAIKLLEEATKRGPQKPENYTALLAALVNYGRAQDAVNLLKDLSQQAAQNSSHTQLTGMLLRTPEDRFERLEPTLWAIQEESVFNLVSESWQEAIDQAMKEELQEQLHVLLLYQGIALVQQKRSNIENALQLWQQCWSCSLESYPEIGFYSLQLAARHIGKYYIGQTIAAKEAGRDPGIHLAALKILGEEASSIWLATDIVRPLIGIYHTITGELEESRRILLQDMIEGLDLLSDEDLDNDWQGYYKIAATCHYAGDELNTLSALYLYKASRTPEPPTAENNHQMDQQRPGDWYCDGGCGRTWSWPEDHWWCKFCYDVQFDSGCLQKLKNNTLSRYVCSSDHEWLYVPSWNQELMTVGPGKVRVGGEMVDGKRVGGENVEVKEWLERLKITWGIKSSNDSVTREST